VGKRNGSTVPPSTKELRLCTIGLLVHVTNKYETSFSQDFPVKIV